MKKIIILIQILITLTFLSGMTSCADPKLRAKYNQWQIDGADTGGPSDKPVIRTTINDYRRRMR